MNTKINRTITLHEGRVFRLVRENVTLENGVTIDLDIVRHPGAAAIVPVTEEGSLFMIRQYRHALGKYIWEIPAGTLDTGETPLQCARRELVEEIGFRADSLEEIGAITPLPGYSDERIHIFLAAGLTPASQNLDKDEILQVHEIRFNEAMGMIKRGEIQDGKTITGLILADLKMKDDWTNND